MAIDPDSKNAQTAAFKATTEFAEGIETNFDKFQLASFTLANGQKVAWPVQRIRQQGANRIVERDRPYRRGAKLDTTGPKAIKWTFDCVFHNTINEPGMSAFNGGQNLYPEMLNLLVELMNKGETGDLVVPTIGRVRAKAWDYSRLEDINLTEGSTVTLMFIEDNEDNVDAATIQAPTINAQGLRMADQTTFDAESQAISGNGMASLRTAASQLQTAVNGPGDSLDDIRTQANTVRHSVEQVETAHSKAGKEGRDALSDPASTDAARSLARLNDTAMRASNAPRRGRPRIITVASTRDTTLQAVAVVFKQDYQELLSINAQLENALRIPPNTIVKIFANDALT